MQPEIHTYPGVAFAACGGVVILLWTGDPSLAANRWVMGKVLGEREVIRGDLVLLQIITPSAGTPGPDARRYIQAAYERELSPTQRIVTAALGDSWRHALVRAISRGMAVFAGKSDFITVVATLPAGLVAATRGRTTPTIAALETCIDAMFLALGATPA